MRPRAVFLALVTLLMVLAAALHAEPLILSHPTNATAWVGDSPTLHVLIPASTPSPTYQWYVSASATGSSPTALTDTGNYSGTATAHLTISSLGSGSLTTTNEPGVTTTPVVAAYYYCAVTSASVTANSAVAGLTIYTTSGTIMPAGLETPAVTVNGGASIAANSTANIPIVISGLHATTAERIRVNHFTSPDGSSTYAFADPLVQSFGILDGSMTKFGGVTNPNIPGDEDLTVNGTIQTHISLPTTPELGREDGKHIIRVISGNGRFRPVDTVLTVTQPALGHTISGQVTDSVTTNPVPYAAIALLDSGNNGEFVSATFADSSGNYSIQAAAGSYMVFAVSPGYVMSQATAPQPVMVSTNLTGQDFAVLPATCTISANFQDLSNSASTLRGVQLFFESKNAGQMVLANTDNNGNAVAAVTAQSDWSVDISALSLSTLGFMSSQSNSSISTVAGSVNAGAVQFTRANALIYGTLTDNAGTPNPLAGATVRANENTSGFQSDTRTDTGGNFYLLAWGPASSPAANWNVGADNQDPLFATNYVLPPGQNVGVLQGHAYPVSLVAPLVTAHLSGTVSISPSGTTSGLLLDLYKVNGQMNSYYGNTTTDSGGNFSFGVNAGDWVIQLNTTNGSNPTNLVGPVVTRTTIDGDNLTGIAFPIATSTASISGTVRDPLNAPVANANLMATATVSTVNYSVAARTDGSGNFSLPVIAGSWTMNTNNNTGAPFYPQRVIPVGASNVTGLVVTPQAVNFNPTNQSQSVGNSAGLNVSYNAPGTPSVQWQVSTNSGSSWSDLANDSTYSGVTNNSLFISNLTLGMNGYQYRAVVSYTYNATPVSENSSAATLTVTAVAPNYFAHPSNQTVNAGTGTYFSVNVSGAPAPTLQWQVSTDSGAHWADLTDTGFYTGSTLSTLNVSTPDTTLNGYQYRCVATNVASAVNSNAGTLTVNALTQSITFNPITAQLMTNSPLTVNATASSGLPVAFSIFSGPATISGNAVTFTGPGTVTVRAAQSGDTFYSSASSVDQSFTVAKAVGTVNLGNLTTTYNGSPKSATATTSPGTYSVDFTYNGSSTAPTAAGSYAVVGTINDTNYAGSASGTLTINKATATVNLSNLTATYDGSPKSASATTSSPSGLAIDLTYGGSSTAPTTAGSYALVGTVNDANYQGTASGTFTINQSTQTISFTGPANQTYPVAPLTLSATASSSLAVTFSVFSGPASVSGTNGTTLTLTGPGTVVVQADQSGDTNYLAAPSVQQSFTVTGGGFAAWLAANFNPTELSNPAITGPNVVLGEDGLSNLLKYALGLAARTNVTTGLPVMTSDGTNWIYTFTKPTSVTDITYTVEFCTDLATWTTTGVTQSAPVSSAGTDTIVSTRALSGAANGYFRLKVTQ